MRNLTGILATIMVACLCMIAPVRADDDTEKSVKENQVKAAFLYNFVKFVQWPGAQALSQTHSADICIAGENNFGSALNLFKQASTPQLALNVKLNVTENDLSTCHLLFISLSEEGRAAPLLARARAYPILTVSSLKGFIEDGGIIEMVKTEKNIGLFSKDKINLRINFRQAEAEGLHIDPQLLEIAAEVIK